jgi:hypothetical protein
MALIVGKGAGTVPNTPVISSTENVIHVRMTTLVLNVTYVLYVNHLFFFYILTYFFPTNSTGPSFQ